jgi:predicted thioesterase
MAEADLEPGLTTVGTCILLKHLAPTPMGATIRVRAEVVGVEGNQLDFKAQIWDEHELVGEAEHRRVIIEEARFLRRVKAKTVTS